MAFIGFGYTLSNFINDHLKLITCETSQEACFNDIDKHLARNKDLVNKCINGRRSFQLDEKKNIGDKAYPLFLERLSEDPRLRYLDIASKLVELQKDFEEGNCNETNVSFHTRSIEEGKKQKESAEKLNLLLKGLKNCEKKPKEAYAFGVFAVLWYFVSDGTEVPSIPDDLKICINKKIDSPFAESLYAMLNATYPDKRGTNTTDKHIVVTRYALYAMIRHYFTNETEFLSLLSDETKTPEELTEKISSLQISSNELSAIQTKIAFDWQTKDNGKKSNLIVVKFRKDHIETADDKQYKKALDLLIEAYMNLPEEFHNNVKSFYKREINTTISDLILSVAYRGWFNRGEHERAELLTICNKLITTHNHHNSYLRALIEKTRDNIYLFKKYDANDYECLRAIQIIKSFFKDNWETEQSASYIGSNFLQWCNDNKSVFDLINNYCYDPKIWMQFASKNNGINTLRQKVQSEIYQKTNLKNEENLKNIMSFLLMTSMGDFSFLAFNSEDEKYNNDVQIFIIFILENIACFPNENQSRLVNGIKSLLTHCNNTYNDYTITKEILNEAKIDWSMKCYVPLKMLYNKVFDVKTVSSVSLEELSTEMIEFSLLTTEEKNNSAKLDEIINILRNLLSNKTFIFNNDTKKALIEIIIYLLDTSPDKYYLTILATSDRWYLFPDEVRQRIYAFAYQFLTTCDYSQQTDTTIKRALCILSCDNYLDSKNSLEKCFLNIKKIKKCRPFNILPLLFDGLTTEYIISKVESEKNSTQRPYSQVICWLLSDKTNRKLLAQQLDKNIIFDFLDKLIDKSNEDLLCEELCQSIIHFAKRQDCFGEKVPSSDEFYSAILLDVNKKYFDLEYLKKKANEHNLSLNTAIFHLCKILKDQPYATAYICIEYLTKFFGQIEYLYNSPENCDLRETLRFQKRKDMFSLLISNPVILNTAKFYCKRMRRFAKILPESIYKLIIDVVNNDQYPSWVSDIDIDRVDRLNVENVPLSKLKYVVKNYPISEKLNKEVNERLKPWLEREEDNREAVYEPTSFILAIKKDGCYNVIDGNRIVENFVNETKCYTDFKIKVCVVEF